MFRPVLRESLIIVMTVTYINREKTRLTRVNEKYKGTGIDGKEEHITILGSSTSRETPSVASWLFFLL